MTPLTTIERVFAREILDSRGNPTVEADVELLSGALGRAAVPSGASTGAHEAHELRDRDERYHGRGVRRAVRAVIDTIGPDVIGRDALDQRGLDEALVLLDGTAALTNLGANAVLAVSLAAARAAAEHAELPFFRYLGGPSAGVLPVPFFNVINGGAHADNQLEVQEFMVAPVGVPSYAEAVRAGAEVYGSLRRMAKGRGFNTNVGDEGGIAPELSSAHEALALLSEAIEDAGYQVGVDVAFGVDVAATELYRDGKYQLEGRTLTSEELAGVLSSLIDDYPIISIEDGLAEDDWAGWAAMTAKLGRRVQLLADDLLVTNAVRLSRALSEGCGNAILIKPNQIGTLTGTLDTIEAARRAGWGAMISHRSGDTEDSAISHLAAGSGVGQLKAGAPARGERTAKYNELLRIEESLGAGARYAGLGALGQRER
jgi:enolase